MRSGGTSTGHKRSRRDLRLRPNSGWRGYLMTTLEPFLKWKYGNVKNWSLGNGGGGKSMGVVFRTVKVLDGIVL